MPPKLTQPLRPVARYRKGKGVQPAVDSDSDEQEQENAQQEEQQQQDTANDQEITSFGGAAAAAAKPQNETDSEDEQPPSKPTFNKQQTVAPKASAAAQEESSEYETESESEEEEQPKILFKPVFVSKRNRDTVQEAQKALDPEKIEQQRLAEIEERKKQSQNLIAESIMRELAEKDAEDKVPDVDDTDGLDPEGEFEAWKLRELKRIKRDKEARYAREKEREEVEARRALPEQLRLKEDMEHAKKTREEKKKGQQAFLQKYHHKGAFYSDLDILKKHDYSAPTESTNVAMDLLPKAMQNKNFGKRSQTKYTHLAAEDTSDKQAGWNKRGPSGDRGELVCFHCGGPHVKRDCPQLAGGVQEFPTGGPRERDSGYGNRGPRREGDDDRYGDYRRSERDRHDDRRRDDRPDDRRRDERRRSRSPPGPSGGERGGRRSGLGYGDREDSYKSSYQRQDDRRPHDKDDGRRRSDYDRKRNDERRSRDVSDDERFERDDKRRKI
ncbi:hypothetical protein OIV83_002284 [Microbotryomycetes sp. JL201]|nr:hypothetical protein OIV83_002284 [Microbotryomycetes sp. JL201]